MLRTINFTVCQLAGQHRSLAATSHCAMPTGIHAVNVETGDGCNVATTAELLAPPVTPAKILAGFFMSTTRRTAQHKAQHQRTTRGGGIPLWFMNWFTRKRSRYSWRMGWLWKLMDF